MPYNLVTLKYGQVKKIVFFENIIRYIKYHNNLNVEALPGQGISKMLFAIKLSNNIKLQLNIHAISL